MLARRGRGGGGDMRVGCGNNGGTLNMFPFSSPMAAAARSERQANRAWAWAMGKSGAQDRPRSEGLGNNGRHCWWVPTCPVACECATLDLFQAAFFARPCPHKKQEGGPGVGGGGVVERRGPFFLQALSF